VRRPIGISTPLRCGVLGLGFLWLLPGIALEAQDPTFQTGVKLVQVTVVAQDPQGKPVPDLRPDEFQIFDNGSPQELRLFRAEAEKSDPAPPEPKAPNTFTNHSASPEGSRSGFSAILIDSPYFGDPTEDGNSLARVQALRMLRSIPTGESIAIYATGRTLRVVCEFTSDRDLLERQLQKWKPGADTPDDIPVVRRPPGMQGDAAADAMRIEALQSIDSGEIDLVADHLAGIPGRKNLLWLSTRFVIGPRALRKLNAAGVAVYPVDVGGVCRLCPPRPIAVMNAVAAQTGGVAYYLRNELDVAMREAMDDGRVSYTLGFYQSGDARVSQVHQLAVRVSRPGVALRYRTTYQTEAQQKVSGNPKADLVQALNRPIDATAIPIQASVTRAQDRLNLEAMLDAASLDLMLGQSAQERSLWTGKIEIVARFTAADGSAAGEALSQTLNLNLRQTTYDAALQHGFIYHNELKIPAKAVELKLLIANPASGKIGTLTIPLSEVQPGVVNAR
jgi:VWFA-related protein